MKKLIRVMAWMVAVVVALVVVLLGWIYVEGRPSHGRPQYVAMGSSFGAGPAITEHADASPWYCMQSRDNYAHQLAKQRGLALVDMTCGGARSKDILEGGLLMLPPQIGVITPQTELVTITIGGNDIGLLSSLMAMGCDANTSGFQRTVGSCKPKSPAEIDQALPTLRDRLGAILDDIHRRAPKARIVLVNYQSILPDSGTCPRLGISAGDADQMRGAVAKLAEVTAAVAQAHGALLLDAQALTHGHDACAADPWVNGMHPEKGLMGAPLHPTLAGMTAIAHALDTLLGAGASPAQ